MKNGNIGEIIMHKPKIALTIAGTDPTGGAGVMADLKSFHACGVYGMATITSIVAQNTLGVQHIHNLETSWVKEQLDSVFDDELPQAIKTGMIATKETMELIQRCLKEHSNIPYVIDPVMLAKSGDSLMDDNTKNHLQSTLLPLADVVTPNIPEAEEITGIKINDSAVITAELAKGRSINDKVKKAKEFISLSIEHTPEIGRGRGPVNHFAYMKKVGLDDE